MGVRGGYSLANGSRMDHTPYEMPLDAVENELLKRIPLPGWLMQKLPFVAADRSGSTLRA